MDHGGAVKLIEAARELGVARYVIVSAMGTQRRRSTRRRRCCPYLEARREADDALMASGLDWTVVRPGRLTDAPDKGGIDAARALGRRGEITREDTALTLFERSCAEPDPRGFDVLGGADAGRAGPRSAVAPPAVPSAASRSDRGRYRAAPVE